LAPLHRGRHQLHCRNIRTSPAFALRSRRECRGPARLMEMTMHGLIYLIGLIVVIMAVLSLLGLR
jgi:hypothetical protein